MKQTVKEQILKVRSTCETNMFDVDAVMRIAYDNGWYELVSWLSDAANRKEYCRFIFTGETDAGETASTKSSVKPKPEDPKPNATESKTETPQATKEEAEAKLSALFDELVPMSGKAETVAGEIVRAISRIGYRNYNDGDHIGVGYGRETCNPAARYLAKNAGEAAAADISNIWGVYNDDRYDTLLAALEADVLAYLEAHPELKSTPNYEDMFDCRDEYEDVDNDDEEDW